MSPRFGRVRQRIGLAGGTFLRGLLGEVAGWLPRGLSLPSFSGLGRQVFILEVAGSNPVGSTFQERKTKALSFYAIIPPPGRISREDEIVFFITEHDHILVPEMILQ